MVLLSYRQCFLSLMPQFVLRLTWVWTVSLTVFLDYIQSISQVNRPKSCQKIYVIHFADAFSFVICYELAQLFNFSDGQGLVNCCKLGHYWFKILGSLKIVFDYIRNKLNDLCPLIRNPSTHLSINTYQTMNFPIHVTDLIRPFVQSIYPSTLSRSLSQSHS